MSEKADEMSEISDEWRKIEAVGASRPWGKPVRKADRVTVSSSVLTA